MTDREEGLKAQGRRLAAWRASQKLSQHAASRMAGCSQGAWAAWELGRKSPDSFFAGELERITRGKLVVKAQGWVFRRSPAKVTGPQPEAKAS